MSNNKEFFNGKAIAAIELSEKAKTRALENYHNLYGPNAIILDELFIRLLNDCLLLSQQKVEGRLISTKIFIPGYYEQNFIWPQGVQFVQIEGVQLTHLKLETLKKFLEIAGDPNTFLVINIINKEPFKFKLEGFLFFDDSLQSFISNYNPWTVSPVAGNINDSKSKIQDKIGCFYRSIFLSIDNGQIATSFYDSKFFIIEEGVISYFPDIRPASMQISNLSSDFQESLRRIKEQRKDTFDSINHFNIEDVIFTIIRDIVLNISNARHGSTLIFGFDGDPDNKNLFQPGAIKLHLPLGNEFIKLIESSSPPFFSYETVINSKKVQTYKKAIISLSKTDGAMIFNKNMDLILAGAILKVDSSAFGSGG
ncbi:hypothetical protein LCGC14_2674640, partial [marine sediment metagenome]